LNDASAADEQVRLSAVVIGRVQGVGFRYFVAEQAERLGVIGWVRNRWDGSVEVTAEGTRKALERLIIQLERGPASAYVSRVQVEWAQATGEFIGFRVRGTT
jgi:acylphosphatase